jgi:hypothetical protein
MMSKQSKQQSQRNKDRVRQTRVDLLICLLADGKWHSTKELIRRVGPGFGVAKYALVRSGVRVERRRQPRARHGYQYRIDLNNPIGYAAGNGREQPNKSGQ